MDSSISTIIPGDERSLSNCVFFQMSRQRTRVYLHEHVDFEHLFRIGYFCSRLSQTQLDAHVHTHTTTTTTTTTVATNVINHIGFATVKGIAVKQKETCGSLIKKQIS
ncbi:hypothetical protein EG68_03846 [Paragonimus skrjabini miyazakii]|uniref:Uncharacterized protein n=1 Tax=Paragonimus skrjabini miyazakii TaxID=59628 RepID=A0A8S9YAH2_9TREM|nr:hypothetical protein EG68_03846 [Paragonimus skrjabini miyazakii]